MDATRISWASTSDIGVIEVGVSLPDTSAPAEVGKAGLRSDCPTAAHLSSWFYNSQLLVLSFEHLQALAPTGRRSRCR